MNWLDKLERKFGRYYISNLMMIISMGSATCYLFSMVFGNGLIDMLCLDPGRILQGQIWRLVTFVFVTPSTSMLYILTIYFYFIAGSSLENVWGAFKFNIYYLVGILSTIVVSFISYFLLKNGINIIGFSSYIQNIYLAATIMNLSLFLAYSKIYPEAQMLLFFIVPIKMKYMGYFNWAIIGLLVIKNIIDLNIIGVLFALAPIVNYLLFFAKNNYREKKMRANSVIRMKDYKKKMNNKKGYTHKCEVCGITDADNNDVEFRYCSKCNGKHCYCDKHILNHEHK